MKLYSKLANLVVARENCVSSNNHEWLLGHTKVIEHLVKEHMPSGGGFNSGTQIDLYPSSHGELVFTTSFHHADDHDEYTHWTDHTVRVKPCFVDGVDVVVEGPDDNGIDEHIVRVFYDLKDIEVE